MLVDGVVVDSKPVKYLGAFLGLGDLSGLNFEKPLKNAWNNLQSWNKRHLTLPARVVIAKTFIASLFIHVLNSIHVHTHQLQIMQNLLNDFLWHGRTKIKQSVSCAPLGDRGLNMLHIKNLVHGLWVKWFQRLCSDCSSSWSKFIWPTLTEIIPHQLLQGLHTISDSIFQKFPPFYTNVLCSYAHTNNLYYQTIDDSSLPQNLWYGKALAYIDYDWMTAGFFMVADLPVVNGKIGIIAVTCKLQSIRCTRSPYLLYCAFQAQFAQYFTTSVEGTFIPNDLLPLAMKCVLQADSLEMLSLNN